MDGSRHKGFAEAPNAAFAPAPGVTPTAIAQGSRFRVRSLCLDPGGATSLQSHLHRSEHWVVVEGTAEVTLDRRSRLVGEGEAVHIPLGQPHRLENPGRLPVTLIAVETGCYLGEDDVISHEQTLPVHVKHAPEAPARSAASAWANDPDARRRPDDADRPGSPKCREACTKCIDDAAPKVKSR